MADGSDSQHGDSPAAGGGPLVAGRRPTTKRRTLAKQQDVARLAGVSSATVSLVLAGRTDRVSEPTRRKVFEAIRALNYKAPAMDVRTEAGASRLIGLLAQNLVEKPLARDPVFRSTLDGVLTECMVRNWGVTVMAENVWDDHGRAIRRSYDGRCDGILLLAPEDDDMVQPFLDRGIPVVQVGITRRTDVVSCVDVDNADIGRVAAQKFFDDGHRHVGFLGSEGQTTSELREQAFIAEAIRLGLSVESFNATSWRPTSEFDALVPAWRDRGVTAVFAWCDTIACSLYVALRRHGVSVPAGMSVITVEGSLSKPLRPTPSGFRLPFEELAHHSVDILIQQIETGDTTPVVRTVPAKYFSRSSTAKRP